MFKKVKILLVLCVMGLQTAAQFQVKNFYSLSGRKNIGVNCIAQDYSGYLWLGTSEGLFRFDGKTTVPFFKDNILQKTEISSLFIDSEETLWIGTKKGKVFFVRRGKIDSLNFGEKPNEERITCFFESGKIVSIGTYGNGIYRFTGGKLSHFTSDDGLSDNVIYKITGNQQVLFCGTDAGITEIRNLGGNPQFKIISHKNGLPDNIVRDLSLLDSKLMVSMQDSGVVYYDLPKAQFLRTPFFSNWSLGTILNSFQVTKNKLILGTEKNGLILICKGILYVYDYPEYIQQNAINQVFIDREEQVWVASKNGLSQFTERRYNLIGTASGLSDTKVLAVTVDNDNSIWIGTTMGISRITNNDRGKTTVEKIKSLDKFVISCATKAPDGSVWFGTYGDGILAIDPKNKKEIRFTSAQHGLSNDNISNLFFDQQNTLYIATLGGGLMKVKVDFDSPAKTLRIEKTFMEEDGLGSNYVYTAITDQSGKLFIGTDGGGLQVYNNGSFTNLTKKFQLNSNTVFSLCNDSKNRIWATSNMDGVLRYDGKSLRVINGNQGLREEQPQQLVFSDGTVFAFNSKGIDKIDPDNLIISYQDIFESDNEPNLNAGIAFGNKIYAGTNNGVLVYRTNKTAADSIKPLVFIKRLLLNYKTFPLDSIFEFRYNQNNFSIAFDANWLKNPAKLLFRYRLHGLEDDWIYTNEGKDINYNNLNPGNYTFMVQVKNEEDVWSSPTGYSFIILTPIWKRLWFWILMMVIGFTLVYVFTQYRLKALQRENILLERRVTERTVQIEKQAQIISQKNKDITDSISYARKIQHAILPADELLKSHLPNSFVLYMTKDIVSGDFYWFSHFGEFSIIAAVDCTGHGVPGAFMSLIGYSQLNRIVNEEGISDPNLILLELNKGVLGVLHKNDSESKDGMDIAICKINHRKNTLEYAGAMRPLWIVKQTTDGPELVEVKADKIPIGTSQKDRSESIRYTAHEIAVSKDEVFYIFTDGYADQFGGGRDKKYSTGRFKELLKKNAALSFSEQEKNIREEHFNWRQDLEQVDDILVIGFSV